MDVWALGVQNRGVSSIIAPNRGRSSRLRRVRHVHRHLPGRRAYFRRLSLQDAPVGDEPRGHDLHALRGRLQDHAGRAPLATPAWRSSAATTATRAGSTAISSASRAATLSTLRITKSGSPQPLVRKNGKLTPATWEEAFELIGKRFREVRDSDRRRQRDRRHRVESHDQRRKLSSFEICARRAEDQ